MNCHVNVHEFKFHAFHFTTQCLQDFRPNPALTLPMSDQPTLQSFFSAVLHTQSQLAVLEHLEDTIIGIGDHLSEHAHPQHSAVEAVRTHLRVVRRALKFLLAVQLRDATRSMQMYLMNTGHLPALDMDFQDE